MSNNTTINVQGVEGMTLRDYLACHASELDVSMVIHEYFKENHSREDYQPITRQQARYIFAEEMIKARKESGNE